MEAYVTTRRTLASSSPRFGLLGNVSTSEDGYDAVVVFTDMFTKQIFWAPVRSKGTTAETIDELFVFHVNTTRKVCPRFCCHGMLSSLQYFLFELL